MRKLILLFGLSMLLVNCEVSEEKGLIVDKAMVVSARQEASKIGSEILKKGGNAYDAMIATHYALAVVYPVAGNIGGASSNKW